jgi:hypothetical protein
VGKTAAAKFFSIFARIPRSVVFAVRTFSEHFSVLSLSCAHAEKRAVLGAVIPAPGAV